MRTRLWTSLIVSGAALLGAVALQRPGWSEPLLDWLTPAWAGRLHMLHFSMRGDVTARHVRRAYPADKLAKLAAGAEQAACSLNGFVV